MKVRLNPMKKMALALLLALSLLLSGCNLVVKDPAVDAKQVILDVNGQKVDKQAFNATYNALLNQEYQLQQMYQAYGMQAPEINTQDIITRAKDQSIRQIILQQQAAKLQLDKLTDEENVTLQAQVDTQYKATLDQVKSYYFADTKLEGDELQKAVETEALALGVTREATEASARETFISGKLEAQVTKDVAVPEEDVKADYDAKVTENKTAYEADANAYGTAVNGGQTVYFAPEGYRWVKQVLIKFLADDQTKIDAVQAELSTAQTALTDAATAKTANVDALAKEGLSDADKLTLEQAAPALQTAVDGAQAKVDSLAQDLLAAKNAGYENILPKAQDVFNKSKTVSFDELVTQFNEDTGMPAQGYAVRKGYANFDAAFVLPAMALENVGDVAEPSQGMYGYYIVQYAAPVEAGPVPYEGVQTALHDALLTTKKTEVWEAQITTWTGEASITTYLDRLTD
jgi:hypothetical protein